MIYLSMPWHLGSLMVFFWISEVIPIYLTALFPFIFAVPLGLIDAQGLSKAYGNTMVYLFLGGFILALALEKWDIHTQIAKRILKVVGNSKPRVLLGFLLSTSLLSMWISNTATALMMLPMALAVIKSLNSAEKQSKFSYLLMLSIAYGSNVGGMATLVGSPPNLQMASILNSQYGTEIGFVEWFQIGLPLTSILTAIIYLVFWLILGKERSEKLENFNMEKTKWTKNQLSVLLVFTLVVVLWTFRQLIAEYTGFVYSDESAAILGALLLFLIPTDETKNLLEWSDTEKLPWGILLLFGGGLAMAEGLNKGGVIEWVSKILVEFNHLPYFAILLILISIAIFGTEVMSNLALVTVFIPVIATFAQSSNLPILQLCMPITLAASCAFMLPVGTPPNAIAFSSGQLKIKQMVAVGFILNVLAVLLISVFSRIFI
jgi:solute carrier family 13 (sodium-dependent dicarboxylate transporter), member 2/3/5